MHRTQDGHGAWRTCDPATSITEVTPSPRQLCDLSESLGALANQGQGQGLSTMVVSTLVVVSVPLSPGLGNSWMQSVPVPPL
jgi:hypothetical protein